MRLIPALLAAALTTLALGGAAKAADISIVIDGPGLRPVSDWRGHDGHERGYGRGGWHGERGPRWNRGYDDDGLRAWPERRSFSRVGGRWGAEECRVIVKRRVSPWGDVRVKRVQICE